MLNGSYSENFFKEKIKPEHIDVVFELGSRDGLDAINIIETYTPSNLYSFECNPESIPICEKNLAPYKNIELQKMGVLDVDGECTFFLQIWRKVKIKI